MNAITLNNKTFIKTQRLGIMCWGELNEMSDETVYTKLEAITGLNLHQIDELAKFACLNVSSMSFDFQDADMTRALLGAFDFGYVRNA